MSFDAKQYKSIQRRGWDNAASGGKYWWQVIEKGAQKINDRLIELAKIKQGDKVLDLATGIGEPAITAAKKGSWLSWPCTCSGYIISNAGNCNTERCVFRIAIYKRI